MLGSCCLKKGSRTTCWTQVCEWSKTINLAPRRKVNVRGGVGGQQCGEQTSEENEVVGGEQIE